MRVLLAESDPADRERLAGMLGRTARAEVIASTDRIAQVRRLLTDHDVDVAMVAADLADGDGNELCREIREEHPGVAVIVIGDHRREAAAMAAFGAGARGFLLVDVDRVTLRGALQAVAAGGTFIDARVAGKLVGLALRGRRTKGPFGLTPQQLRVLERLPRGLTYREIGEEMGIHRETVRSHVRQITRKLGASDRAEAAAIAVRHGIVEP